MLLCGDGEVSGSGLVTVRSLLHDFMFLHGLWSFTSA